MHGITQLYSDADIPGVRPAGQARSRQLQDRFVVAGRERLLTTRLHDLQIPVLAQEAQSSVGGFYSRFESKEAFFEFMRMKMFEEHFQLHDEHLDPARFIGKSRRDVVAAFVDMMLIVYSGSWRGVLREGYSAIPDRPESWEPMKLRGQILRERLFPLIEERIENTAGLSERVSFAVQLLFSALNNEMMNPNLAFGIIDPRFRFYLISSFDALVEACADAPSTADHAK